MNSPQYLARIAGVLYLLIALSSGFALLFVDARMYVPGDATTTAGNMVANAGLVRLGLVADLFQATVFVFLAMILYRLLRHVQQSAASAMVILVAIASGIMCLDAVFRFAALRVATDTAYVSGFGTAGASALVLLLLETQHYGFLIAQIFFGLWLVPLGYLASTSRWFPRALGVLLIVGGACYLVDMLGQFLIPEVGERIHGFVVIPSTIAELWMVGYLLVRGIRPSHQTQRTDTTPTPAATEPATA
jgi:hypothetical protein